MATTSITPVSNSGGAHLKSRELRSMSCNSFGNPSRLTFRRKSSQRKSNHKLYVRAEYNESRGQGADFVAGFVLGGALFGTLAYIFAPQIRRSILNEDEHGFQRPRQLTYSDEPSLHDERFKNIKQTLNSKIGQLNSTIDKVSSRLKGGNHMPPVPTESDPKEATT